MNIVADSGFRLASSRPPNHDAPPQTTFRSSLNVNPGRTEQSVFRARRKWFAVVVEVNCEARP